MCNKAINTSPSTIQFVRECCKTYAKCVKAVDTCPLAFESVPGQYKTQEMCDRDVSEDSFMLRYCLYKYKIQEMCDNPVNDCLSATKFVPNWFVASKIIKKSQKTLFTDDDILLFDENW